MALAINQLPDDVASLKRLLVERDAEVMQRLAELEAQRGEILAARLLIEKLKLATRPPAPPPQRCPRHRRSTRPTQPQSAGSCD
jgi:hypothetical protein